MKRSLLYPLAALLFLSAGPLSPAQDKQALSLHLQKEMTLSFSTLVDLDSRTSRVGTEVPLRLEQPLLAGGYSLLDAGEVVRARVSKVRQPGRHERHGDVVIELKQVILRDGTKVPVRVWFAFPGKIPVPAKHHTHGLREFFRTETLAFGVAAVVTSPALLGYRIYDHFHAPRGSHYNLPAGSTVAVWITQEKIIRYHPAFHHWQPLPATQPKPEPPMARCPLPGPSRDLHFETRFL